MPKKKAIDLLVFLICAVLMRLEYRWLQKQFKSTIVVFLKRSNLPSSRLFLMNWIQLKEAKTITLIRSIYHITMLTLCSMKSYWKRIFIAWKLTSHKVYNWIILGEDKHKQAKPVNESDKKSGKIRHLTRNRGTKISNSFLFTKTRMGLTLGKWSAKLGSCIVQLQKSS